MSRSRFLTGSLRTLAVAAAFTLAGSPAQADSPQPPVGSSDPACQHGAHPLTGQCVPQAVDLTGVTSGDAVAAQSTVPSGPADHGVPTGLPVPIDQSGGPGYAISDGGPMVADTTADPTSGTTPGTTTTTAKTTHAQATHGRATHTRATQGKATQGKVAAPRLRALASPATAVLPDAGGFPLWLAPTGLATMLAGAALVVTARRRTMI